MLGGAWRRVGSVGEIMGTVYQVRRKGRKLWSEPVVARRAQKTRRALTGLLERIEGGKGLRDSCADRGRGKRSSLHATCDDRLRLSENRNFHQEE